MSLARAAAGIDWLAAGGQIVGARRRQEDCWAVETDPSAGWLLAVVADGMGGHRGGEVASRLAVETFTAAFKALGDRDAARRMGDALEAANEAIRGRAADDPALEGMGTTLVAVLAEAGHARWISVGDSPLFLVDGAAARRINADHSMKPVLEAMAAQGRITPEQAAEHPSRNALRSVLIGEALDLVDRGEMSFGRTGARRLVLASDGIDTLAADEVAAAAARRTPAEAVQSLLRAVEDAAAPGQDNATAIVLAAAD